MKVFISCSGELSRLVAVLLSSWIQNTIQGIEGWIFSGDIDKGSLWFPNISTELAETCVGIICLTQENMNAPWILFEAGALAKGLSNSRVCPLLINLSSSDLIPPLSQFNATLPEKADMLKLVKTINAQRKEDSLSEDLLEKAFEKWWDEFDTGFQGIIANYEPKKEIHQRSTDDMIEEILQITRAIQRNLPISTTIGTIDVGDIQPYISSKSGITSLNIRTNEPITNLITGKLSSPLRPFEELTLGDFIIDGKSVVMPADVQIVQQSSKEEKPKGKRKIKKAKSDTK